ncbi:MAG: arylsulfatase [Pirellulales bacterium]
MNPLQAPFNFLTLVCLVLVASCWAQAEELKRPNIVLLMTDDQGYGDVGIHGNSVIQTPTMDRFANEGTQLSRFYCSPVCAPTRASLMTGRYFYRTGVIHTSRGGAKMHSDEITMAEYLRTAGYETAVFGKWHLGDNYPMRPQDQGFSHSTIHKSGGIDQSPDKPNSYFDPLLWKDGHAFPAKGYCTDIFFDEAIHFIEDHRDVPWFVYLATNTPHTPLQVAEEAVEPYRKAGVNDTTAKIYAMVTNIDENFSRLLAKLEELHLRENTIVIFMSDNGPQQKRYNAGMRERKSWVYEGGIRVPCYIQWPAVLKKQRKLNTPLAHIDWLPTLLDLCGASKNNTPADAKKLDGQSFAGYLKDETNTSPDRLLFFQCHRGLDPEPFHNAAVISQRYKLVCNPGTFGSEQLAENAKQFELYDLIKDPSETTDLAQQHPDELKRLLEAHQLWFADVKAERNFEPGQIVLGASAEPQSILCRYQDGHFEQGKPQGWSVVVSQTGQYEVRINQTIESGEAIHYVWNNQRQVIPASKTKGQTSIIPLTKGHGRLDIWVQKTDGNRSYFTENNTVGDVFIRKMVD